MCKEYKTILHTRDSIIIAHSSRKSGHVIAGKALLTVLGNAQGSVVEWVELGPSDEEQFPVESSRSYEQKSSFESEFQNLRASVSLLRGLCMP